MTISLTGFTVLIVLGIAGAAVLMAALLVNFISELKKNEIW